MAACEYDDKCPLTFSMLMNQIDPPQILQPFEKFNVEHIGLFDHDRYFVIVKAEKQIEIFAVENLSQSLFQFDFKTKSSSKFIGLETSHPDILVLMFAGQLTFLVLKFHNLNNRFEILSEQTFVMPIREHSFSIRWTPKRKFLIVEQSLNLEDDAYLNDLRIFICDQPMKISGPSTPICYTKSKMARGSGKIIGFYEYVASFTRSILWIAHQGNILHVVLPSTNAELEIRPDYHSWMRHALALYQKTTEKSSLAILITSLAIQTRDDSILASGGNDGSIVLWSMMNNQYSHTVLESIHNDEVRERQREFFFFSFNSQVIKV